MNNLFNWTPSGFPELILLVLYLSYMNTPWFRNVNTFYGPNRKNNLIIVNNDRWRNVSKIVESQCREFDWL